LVQEGALPAALTLPQPLRYFDFFPDRSALVGLELAGEAQKLDF